MLAVVLLYGKGKPVHRNGRSGIVKFHAQSQFWRKSMSRSVSIGNNVNRSHTVSVSEQGYEESQRSANAQQANDDPWIQTIKINGKDLSRKDYVLQNYQNWFKEAIVAVEADIATAKKFIENPENKYKERYQRKQKLHAIEKLKHTLTLMLVEANNANKQVRGYERIVQLYGQLRQKMPDDFLSQSNNNKELDKIIKLGDFGARFDEKISADNLLQDNCDMVFDAVLKEVNSGLSKCAISKRRIENKTKYVEAMTGFGVRKKREKALAAYAKAEEIRNKTENNYIKLKEMIIDSKYYVSESKDSNVAYEERAAAIRHCYKNILKYSNYNLFPKEIKSALEISFPGVAATRSKIIVDRVLLEEIAKNYQKDFKNAHPWGNDSILSSIIGKNKYYFSPSKSEFLTIIEEYIKLRNLTKTEYKFSPIIENAIAEAEKYGTQNISALKSTSELYLYKNLIPEFSGKSDDFINMHLEKAQLYNSKNDKVNFVKSLVILGEYLNAKSKDYSNEFKLNLYNFISELDIDQDSWEEVHKLAKIEILEDSIKNNKINLNQELLNKIPRFKDFVEYHKDDVKYGNDEKPKKDSKKLKGIMTISNIAYDKQGNDIIEEEKNASHDSKTVILHADEKDRNRHIILRDDNDNNIKGLYRNVDLEIYSINSDTRDLENHKNEKNNNKLLFLNNQRETLLNLRNTIDDKLKDVNYDKIKHDNYNNNNVNNIENLNSENLDEIFIKVQEIVFGATIKLMEIKKNIEAYSANPVAPGGVVDQDIKPVLEIKPNQKLNDIIDEEVPTNIIINNIENDGINDNDIKTASDKQIVIHENTIINSSINLENKEEENKRIFGKLVNDITKQLSKQKLALKNIKKEKYIIESSYSGKQLNDNCAIYTEYEEICTKNILKTEEFRDKMMLESVNITQEKCDQYNNMLIEHIKLLEESDQGTKLKIDKIRDGLKVTPTTADIINNRIIEKYNQLSSKVDSLIAYSRIGKSHWAEYCTKFIVKQNNGIKNDLANIKTKQEIDDIIDIIDIREKEWKTQTENFNALKSKIDNTYLNYKRLEFHCKNNRLKMVSDGRLQYLESELDRSYVKINEYINSIGYINSEKNKKDVSSATAFFAEYANYGEKLKKVERIYDVYQLLHSSEIAKICDLKNTMLKMNLNEHFSEKKLSSIKKYLNNFDNNLNILQKIYNVNYEEITEVEHEKLYQTLGFMKFLKECEGIVNQYNYYLKSKKQKKDKNYAISNLLESDVFYNFIKKLDDVSNNNQVKRNDLSIEAVTPKQKTFISTEIRQLNSEYLHSVKKLMNDSMEINRLKTSGYQLSKNLNEIDIHQIYEIKSADINTDTCYLQKLFAKLSKSNSYIEYFGHITKNYNRCAEIQIRTAIEEEVSTKYHDFKFEVMKEKYIRERLNDEEDVADDEKLSREEIIDEFEFEFVFSKKYIKEEDSIWGHKEYLNPYDNKGNPKPWYDEDSPLDEKAEADEKQL
jgi:hypothetical protein